MISTEKQGLLNGTAPHTKTLSYEYIVSPCPHMTASSKHYQQVVEASPNHPTPRHRWCARTSFSRQIYDFGVGIVRVEGAYVPSDDPHELRELAAYGALETACKTDSDM